MSEMISATPTLRAPIRRWRSRLCGRCGVVSMGFFAVTTVDAFLAV